MISKLNSMCIVIKILNVLKERDIKLLNADFLEY